MRAVIPSWYLSPGCYRDNEIAKNNRPRLPNRSDRHLGSPAKRAYSTYFPIPWGGELVSLPKIQIEPILSQPFAENTYVAQLEGRSDCVIVDPGLEPDLILEYIAQRRLQPAAILCTHGHADHIGGNEALKRCWPDCPLVIGAGDAPKLTDAMLNLSAPFGMPITSPPADVLVHDGETYSAAGLDLLVLDTPGHSCGHVVFVWKGGSPWVVFGGDVLFRRGIGRFDFPDGSFEQLAAAIHEKLFTLPDDTLVLPGHGQSTTIGEEKRINPYVGERQ
jgi:hydroxyacylglutathione hydrolase